jgi:glycerol-3-phosphate dehydrogenase
LGGAIARELSHYKLSVLCLEKEADVCCGISKANTGIIHSPALIPAGTAKAFYSTKARNQFAQLSSNLGFGYEEPGAMILAFSKEDLSTLQGYIKQANKNYADAGLTPPVYKTLQGEGLFKKEPRLNKDIVMALYAPDTGRIIPYEYGIALWENAVNNGVELKLSQQVVSVKKLTGEDAGWVLNTGTEDYEAKYVINASGHGSNAIGAQAGFAEIPIEKVKGQYLILDRAYDIEINHILFQVPKTGEHAKGKGILVTKTVYGNIMIGPDAQNVLGTEETSTDIDSLKEVIQGARRSVPALDIRRTIKNFAGLRPRPAGGDFIISSKGNFIHFCGIESPGLTASPALAEEAVRRLSQMGLELNERAAYRPQRKPLVDHIYHFQGNELKNRIQLPDTDPDQLVCRCEQVPRGRILDSLHRGIPVTTIDAVKRRTRAGQGRCQGAFCGARVRKVLASKWGTEEESITQRGNEPEPSRVPLDEIRKLN